MQPCRQPPAPFLTVCGSGSRRRPGRGSIRANADFPAALSHRRVQHLLLPATAAAGAVTILPRFEPEAVLRTIGANWITYAGGLPLVVNALVNNPEAGKYVSAHCG
jgi:hypothetical protein